MNDLQSNMSFSDSAALRFPLIAEIRTSFTRGATSEAMTVPTHVNIYRWTVPRPIMPGFCICNTKDFLRANLV